MKKNELEEAIELARRRRTLPTPIERKLLRVRAGVRQSDVAVSIGTTCAAVSRYERGRRMPGGAILSRYYDVLARLARAGSGDPR